MAIKSLRGLNTFLLIWLSAKIGNLIYDTSIAINNFESFMKVLLIDPSKKEITEHEVPANLEALQNLIGYATIDSDEIDLNGDRLYFDEECFIRQQEVGRFKVDRLAPVAGMGVIVNSPDEGKTFLSPKISLAELVKRVTFI
jgi:hypothetical protein